MGQHPNPEHGNPGRVGTPLAWSVALLAVAVLGVSLILVQRVLPRPSEQPSRTQVAVPDFTGHTLAGAQPLAADAELVLDPRSEESDEPAGTIIRQVPRSGTVVDRGSMVVVTIAVHGTSPGKSTSEPAVPTPPAGDGTAVGDYRCLTLADATAALERDGFRLGDVAYTSEGGPVDDTWLVGRQTPEPSERRPAGSSVDLVVSSPFFVCT